MKLFCLTLVTFCTAVLFSQAVRAGGSWVPVHINEIKLHSDTDYTLTITPLEDGDFYFRSCKRFVINGSFSRLNGASWFWKWSSKHSSNRKKHLDALRELRLQEGKNSTLNFGWMGRGFKIIDPSNPCVVESRALKLIKDSNKPTIVSYFNKT